jgi:DNA invertase Pin-like site-specific DNA recombinase
MLRAESERRGWDVEMVLDAGFSGKDMRRPGLGSALERLDAGDAQVLIALRLDRLSRSVADFAALLARARRRSWRLVLLDPVLDTEDAAGKFTAHVLAAAAEYERDLIAARTREGMAQRRLEGVQLGRPRVVPDRVIARNVHERASGDTLRRIAEGLTTDGVPTARGGRSWRTSSVQGLLDSHTGRQIRAESPAQGNAPGNLLRRGEATAR